jgi:hypothetical protein
MIDLKNSLGAMLCAAALVSAGACVIDNTPDNDADTAATDQSNGHEQVAAALDEDSDESADSTERADDGGGIFDGIARFVRNEPTIVEVPAGTSLAVSFENGISSNASQVGEAVQARVVEPVTIDGVEAIPAGSVMIGEVTAAHPPKIGGRAQLAVSFYSLELPDGTSVPISAGSSWIGKSERGKDAATIAGSTIGGAILGHQVENDDKGKVIGGLVGAAAGTAIAHKTKGQPVGVAAGTVVQMPLDAPARVEIS